MHANQLHFKDTKDNCLFWQATGIEDRSEIEVCKVMLHVIYARDLKEDLLADSLSYRGLD
jgi:hypothetical protein